MKLAIIGSTGMLGQALVSEARKHSCQVTGIARSSADYCLDITDNEKLKMVLDSIKADVVVNCAALTSLAVCENDPGRAYLVNARAVALMAEI